jgi:hypothetical protein
MKQKQARMKGSRDPFMMSFRAAPRIKALILDVAIDSLQYSSFSVSCFSATLKITNMRFVIAASILATQAIPAFALDHQGILTKNKLSEKLLAQRRYKEVQNKNLFYRNTKNVRKISKTRDDKIYKGKIKEAIDPPRVLRNQRTVRKALRNSSKLPQCDPDEEVDADIGILVCGVGEYCIESDLSGLGGFCMSPSNISMYSTDQQERNLQSDFYPAPTVCDPNHRDFESYDCECSAFDVARNLGEFTCTLHDYQCKRDKLCGANTVTHTIESDGGAHADYCYDFVKPFDMNMCYSLDMNRSCKISIQNEECSSCEVVDGIKHPVYGFIGFNCYEFDCSNIEPGLKGNNCAGDYVLDDLAARTLHPSIAPSGAPSFRPTNDPSRQPSHSPSRDLSSNPPSLSLRPTFQPSMTPSKQASANPTQSFAPTTLPSSSPTISEPPSIHPSSTPTLARSGTPSSIPSKSPSKAPSISPTLYPTLLPSVIPTLMDSHTPTLSPTGSPSMQPSHSPTRATAEPSSYPSFEPWHPGKDIKSEENRGKTENSGGTARRAGSLSFCFLSIIMFAYQFG